MKEGFDSPRERQNTIGTSNSERATSVSAAFLMAAGRLDRQSMIGQTCSPLTAYAATHDSSLIDNKTFDP
ncbi:MAG: hypothetical protein WBY12_09100, partial [Hyphomicrobium sp.]